MKFLFTLLSIFLTLSNATSSFAQVQSFNIQSGETYNIALSSSDAAIKEIHLNMEAKRTDAQLFKLSVSGPNNLKAQVEITPLMKNGKQGKPYLMNLSNNSGKKLKTTVLIKTPAASTSGSGHHTQAVNGCAGMSQVQIDFLTNFYNQIHSTNLTPEQFCNLNTGGGNNTSNNSPGSNSGPINTFYGLLLKDSCSKDKVNYLVKVKLLRNELTPAQLTEDSSITVEATEIVDSKNNGASIKEKSDGKFAPHPLYLGQTLGSYGAKDRLFIVRWSGGKIKKIAKLVKVDNVYYKGAVLARIPLKNILNGGKASFILTNLNGAAHDACFKLKRKRQYSGNYPK